MAVTEILGQFYTEMEVYREAYDYYTKSRAKNGNPPAVTLTRYREMVPLNEAIILAKINKGAQ